MRKISLLHCPWQRVCLLLALAFATSVAAAGPPPPPNLYSEAKPSTLRNSSGAIVTKGVMLVIHGGGWTGVGSIPVQNIDNWARRYNAIGWATLNIDYRPGKDSVKDVAAWYDYLKGLAPNYPICAYGQSAGAHLSLVLAIQRPLSCAIGHSTPTNLATLAGTEAERAALPGNIFQLVANKALEVFGADELALYSPLTWVGAPYHAIPGQVLLASTVRDSFVPLSQQRTFAAKHPRTSTIELLDSVAPGEPAFGHSQTSWTSLLSYLQREEVWLNYVADPRSPSNRAALLLSFPTPVPSRVSGNQRIPVSKQDLRMRDQAK